MVTPRQALVGCFLAVALAMTALAAPPREITWQSSYRKAHNKAASESKLLVVVFSTDPCPWCVKLNASLATPVISEFLAEYCICVKIDDTHDAWVSRALGIESFPAVVIANPKGAIIYQLQGYQTSLQLLDKLHRARVEAAKGRKP